MADHLPRIAVGAIVVRDDHLLMVKRAKAPGEGLWSIPGGHVEGGEYLAQAVRREVLEETGVEVDVGDLVGILEVPGRTHLVILDFAARPRGRAEPVAAGDAAEAAWVPFARIETLECTPRFLETLRGWGVVPDAPGEPGGPPRQEGGRS